MRQSKETETDRAPVGGVPAVRYLEIDEGAEGQRLDNFLMRELKGVPKSLVYRLLRRGEVRVNKGRAKPGRRLHSGDRVRIPPVRTATREAPRSPDDGLRELVENAVLYEDERLLFVNKPSGLAVHGGSGVSLGLIEVLRALRPTQRQLELVHRIDRDTSGCLMVAKRRSALRTIQTLQREGRIGKRYLALLAGRWRRDSALVDAPLRKNLLSGGERVVRVDAAGKPSRTRFRVVSRFAEATLVEATLETGRTHQIRVHAAYLGTPILGDLKYGDAAANRRFRGLGLRRLFLHAASLRLRWPDGGRRYAVEAPLPAELREVLDRLEGEA